MKRNLCMGCMREKGEDTVCPHCGYEEGTPYFASYLPPGTMIDDRYLAGKVISYNGESVIYTGYDTMSNRRVDIREYFPDTLAMRNADGRSIRVSEGRQIQFKAYMGDYLEVIHKLSRMRTLSCVVQVQGIVEAHNTVYAVMEHIDGCTIRQYLSERGTTMLTWAEASDLFLPMLKTLRLIHQDGLIHRGISADTVLITRNNTVKLDGFAISAVRAARTDLVAELFPGYSAPEQYSTISPHGSWTDVYAISALLYTVLTGQRPPEALIRSPEKQLMPPRERNETVPAAVSQTLLDGLELSIRGRIQDMDTLIARLTGEAPLTAPSALPPILSRADSFSTISLPAAKPSDEDEGHTAYYSPSSTANGAPPSGTSARRMSGAAPISAKRMEDEEEAAAKAHTRKLIIMSMSITLPILLLALLFTFWFLFGGRDRNPNDNSNALSTVTTDSGVSDEWLVSSHTRPESGASELLSGEDSSHAESSQPVIKMENFVGKKYVDVIANANYKKIYLFSEPEYVGSDKYAEGLIVEQDVTAGIEITEGTKVQLKVSKGIQTVILPDYENKTEEAYLSELKALGVTNVTVIYRDDPSYQKSGYVVGINRPIEADYDLLQQPLLEIYVSRKPA